ncbi:glycosyltransferase family 20-domain-containing protein, partial [Zopfochytrium polystomum]
MSESRERPGVDPIYWRIEPSGMGNIGLQNAVESLDLSHLSSIRRLWVGSPGRVNTEAWSANTKAAITKALWECGLCCVPVFLTEEELEGHYNQFCKRILWRPFHYQLADHPKGQAYEELAWRQYVAVNQKFADAIASVYQPNDIVWVNDYHLMLVPAMVRQLIPDAAIGFFLHIPFPSSEIFRCLHVRKQILEGMLGADLIGFQTYSFMRHFLMTCTRILSLESTPKGIQLDKRVVSVGIFPIGINLKVLNEKKKHPEVLEMVAALREKYAGKKVVIGRDKNDYVKGVRQKMLAYERFLNLHPEFVGKVVLIQVALPTTEENELEGQVSDLVARINSKFGSIEYLPVVYLQQDLSFNHYLALLSMADACLITSLRDGMNLTSHEYIACQEKKKSPLIISEFAGTYGSFGSALRVNPWDTREVADAIFDALTMTEDEKLVRWGDLFDYIQKHTAQNYVETFVKEIPRVHDATQHMEASHIPLLELSSVREDFESSTKRIFFLDHDGTLCVPRQFLTPQEIEVTTIATRELLTRLASDPRNFVYLISGRTRESLAPFYGIKNVGLSAENGCFVMVANRARWDTMLTDQDLSWRSQVLEIFEYYTDRTPGSYIEQKEISLVWHFSSAQSSFGSWQAAECQNHIQVALGSTYPIYTLVKKNSIEVMPRNVNKGVICRRVTDYHQSGRSVSRRTSHNFVRDEQNGQVAPLASSGGFMHDGNPSPMPSPVISASDGQTDEGLSPTTPQNMSHSLISSSSPYSSSSPPSHGHAGAHFYQHQHHSPSGASDVSAHTTRMHGTHGPGHGHHNHHRHHTHTSEHSRTRSARGDPIDFIFCIGDDRSDELMFEYVNRLA